MNSFFLILSFLVTGLLWKSSSASPDSLNEISAQITGCPADAEEPWSYRGDNGPDCWSETYPQCNGARQSPISVDSRRAHEIMEKLYFNWYRIPVENWTVENNGKTIRVIPHFPDGYNIFVNNFHYFLNEIHFHWGTARNRGSEHIVDGTRYAMEMHLVHRLSEDEYAVVAVFFEQFAGINAELQHIVNELPKVMYKNTSVNSRYYLNLMNLLPENPASFYLYNGSLTTPDCEENTTWVLLKTPIPIGNTQIREFRKLFSATQEEAEAGCKITGNIRPVQHLHGRQVYSSK